MTNKVKAPTWFWVIAVIALIWNIMGVLAYLDHTMMTAEAMEAMPEAQRTAYENMPAWATGAFAIAVFSGFLGALMLLLRKAVSALLFIISMLGVLVQDYYNFIVIDSMEIMGGSAIIMPLIVLIFGVYLITLSRKAKANSWIS